MPFKTLALSGDYSRVSLSLPSSLALSANNLVYLKAALMQLVESCLDVFQEHTDRDYDHWLADPILLRIFQDIFDGELNLGVLVSLRPWRRKIPDPYLSSSCAPMRMLIEGHIREWHVRPLEDIMRLLSHSQLHAPVDEADLHIHVFGYLPDDWAT